VIEYIKDHFSNAMLFAISKSSKGNHDGYSYAEVFNTPETRALAEYVYTILVGDINSEDVKLLELKKLIKQVVETDEFE
jgi:hypothetical protein